MKNIKISVIGKVQDTDNGFVIKLNEKFRNGLTGLDGYSHLNIIWWADQVDNPEYRKIIVTEKPYKKGPDKLGIFATRSPVRPNPIATTAVFVTKIDHKKGIVLTPFIDAEPGTPVLDIKPYLPAADIVKNFKVPEWSSHWPLNIEESAEFDWESEFNFLK
jgi:tRNA-Thr(GGU) m(6)t(6)A37 methyltransferase TsaA